MRPELKPNIEFVKRIFPEILKLLENYVNDNNRSITVLEKKLTKLTGKNIKKYYLSSWLKEDENDDIAFVLSLPKNNKKYKNITRDELYEIIHFIKLEIKKTIDEYEMEKKLGKTFEEKHKNKFVGYYMNILKNNFKRYNDELFYKHKDKNGNYIGYNVEEIIKIIMG
jgi:hypothetical protein